MSTRYILSNTAAKRKNEDYRRFPSRIKAKKDHPVVHSVNFCHLARSFVIVGSIDVASLDY
jgi:hypothetical protein